MVVAELAQEIVQLMLVEGLALSEIDGFIERQPLDDDERAALWLWAWAEQSLAAR